MPNDKIGAESAQAIFDEAIKVRDGLGDLISQIAVEDKEIQRTAARANRPLTPAEEAHRDKLDAHREKLRQALDDLSFETLERLDNSADVTELKGKLDSVNDDLKAELGRLKNIAHYAEIAAKVLDALTQLAIKAAAALAK